MELQWWRFHGIDELAAARAFKTKLCRYWQCGYCPNAEACTFAHGEYELRGRRLAQRLMARGSPSTARAPPATSTSSTTTGAQPSTEKQPLALSAPVRLEWVPNGAGGRALVLVGV
jgi:hypothetical protein